MPQWNGVSERRNLTLLDMVRSMMSHTDLPTSFWGYALETAAFTLTRVPSKSVQKTPHEMWTGKRPSMSFMKVWGCKAYVKHQMFTKLEPKSHKYQDEPKTYQEAVSSPDYEKWLEAMRSEMDSMSENQVWTLVEPHEGIKPIWCKWVFKKKTDMDGNKDVKTAFLNGKLEEDVYMTQPEGFITPGNATKSSKQDTIVDSTTEAEYIAASEAAKEAVWIKKFITELAVVPSISDAIELYCDNNGAIAQAKEPRSHQRSKHILRCFHLIREILDRGDVEICKVHTNDNIADPLTKPLAQQKHDRHTESLGIRYTPIIAPVTITSPARADDIAESSHARKRKMLAGRTIQADTPLDAADKSADAAELPAPQSPAKRQRRYHVISSDNDYDGSADPASSKSLEF
ncbi:hypothetical protein V6N13_008065 [Hibiscus sabdariffa]